MRDIKENLEQACESIAGEVGKAVQELVKKTVMESFQTTIDALADEGNFYKSMNQEMMSGLKGIYKNISQTTANGGADETSKLFEDASNRLEEIMESTKTAAETIMGKVELLLAQQEEAGTIIATIKVADGQESNISRLDELIGSQDTSLTDILTALSFQDLTGQRLLKVMEAVEVIKNTVFDLYISSGLMLRDRKEYPKKDIETIRQESRKKIKEIKNSELKGPSSDVSQDDVDDLLASLGL